MWIDNGSTGGSFGPPVYCSSSRAFHALKRLPAKLHFLNNHPFLYVLTLLKTQLP
nr:MAG TPA: Serine proteinase inhibitor 2, CRMA, APOPTOSIS, ICE INHIBITOR.65A [Caudoviricetes sp.]